MVRRVWRTSLLLGLLLTVPVGATVGKGFELGGQMIDCNLGYYHNVVRPDGAPRSKVMFTLKFLWARE